MVYLVNKALQSAHFKASTASLDMRRGALTWADIGDFAELNFSVLEN